MLVWHCVQVNDATSQVMTATALYHTTLTSSNPGLSPMLSLAAVQWRHDNYILPSNLSLSPAALSLAVVQWRHHAVPPFP